MISLSTPKEPFDIELPYSITVTVNPLTTAGMASAQAAARRRIEGLEARFKELKESGLPADEFPGLDDDAERDGLFHDLLIKELAVRHISDWSGIEDDPPVTRENVAAVMDLYPVGERFFQEFTLRQVLLNAAKNAFGPSVAGTSSPAEGPDTAKDAGTTVSLAPTAA